MACTVSWSIENIFLWVSEIQARQQSPVDTVDEVWLRLEAAWNELTISII